MPFLLGWIFVSNGDYEAAVNNVWIWIMLKNVIILMLIVMKMRITVLGLVKYLKLEGKDFMCLSNSVF